MCNFLITQSFIPLLYRELRQTYLKVIEKWKDPKNNCTQTKLRVIQLRTAPQRVNRKKILSFDFIVLHLLRNMKTIVCFSITRLKADWKAGSIETEKTEAEIFIISTEQ